MACDLPGGGGLLSHSAFSIICLASLSALHCSLFCWISCCSSVLQVVMRSWCADGDAVLLRACRVGFLGWTTAPSDACKKSALKNICLIFYIQINPPRKISGSHTVNKNGKIFFIESIRNELA